MENEYYFWLQLQTGVVVCLHGAPCVKWMAEQERSRLQWHVRYCGSRMYIAGVIER